MMNINRHNLQGWAFLENAGASQVPTCVTNAIREYMEESYAQPAAGYDVSERAATMISDTRAFLQTYVNGQGHGHVCEIMLSLLLIAHACLVSFQFMIDLIGSINITINRQFGIGICTSNQIR
jgi:hypothetical protein